MMCNVGLLNILPCPRSRALGPTSPTGFFLMYQAWRRNVAGIVQGPVPFFWGVTKAV
jgi:hypothetical protein